MTATDEDGDTASKPFAWTVAADLVPGFGATALPVRTWARNQAIVPFVFEAASGGDAPLSYAIAGLPAGVGMSIRSRRISGTPTAAGSGTATVTVTDTDGDTASKSFSWTVVAVSFGIAASPNPSGTGAYTVSGSVPTSQAHEWYQLLETAPDGTTRTLGIGGPLRFSSSISGRSGGTYTYRVQGCGFEPHPVYQEVVEVCHDLGSPLSVEVDFKPGFSGGSAPARSWTQNEAIASFTFEAATGGDGTLSYTASGLPAGVTMSGGRVISGTPTEAGSGTATMTTTDADGDEASKSFGWTVAEDLVPTFGSTPIAARSWTENEAIPAFTFEAASGGDAPLRYSVEGLPSGVSMSSARRISGTPTAAGSGTATVTATDGDGDEAHKSFAWTVAPADRRPSFGSATAPSRSWTEDQTISAFTFEAATGGDGTLSYTIRGLPAGVSMSGARRISGMPTEAGSGTATVTATDEDGDTASKSFGWTVAPGSPPPPPLPDRSWAVNQPIDPFTLPAAPGGAPPFTYSIGGLPSGLSMSGARAVSGTPTVAGSGTATYTATDANGDTFSQSFGWTVTEAPSAAPPVPGALSGPNSSTDGTYTIAWGGSDGATRFELQQSLNGGAWTAIATTGTSTTRMFVGQRSGEYVHRVRACNASACSAWTAGKLVFVSLPPQVGFDAGYVARAGDLGSDGTTDIYLSPLAIGTGNVGEFILKNEAGSFVLETGPTNAELAAAQSWPLAAQLDIVLEDINVDGVWDALVTGITGASGYAGAVDQIVVGPRTVGGAPTGLVAVDADLIGFFDSVKEWYKDLEHFDTWVEAYTPVIYRATNVLERAQLARSLCNRELGLHQCTTWRGELRDYYGGTAQCVLALASNRLVLQLHGSRSNVDSPLNIARDRVCNETGWAVFAWLVTPVKVKSFSGVRPGVIEHVANFVHIWETGESEHEVEDLADVLENVVGIDIGGGVITDRIEEIHQALLNIWAILGRRIQGEGDDADTAGKIDSVYVTKRRINFWGIGVGIKDSHWHLALEYSWRSYGEDPALLQNLTIAAYKEGGRLVAKRNHPSERNNLLAGKVAGIQYPNNLQLWLTLNAADRNYRNCPPFVVYDNPFGDDEGAYNSNGYIHALVKIAKAAVITVTNVPFAFSTYFLGDDPVPSEEFTTCRRSMP